MDPEVSCSYQSGSSGRSLETTRNKENALGQHVVLVNDKVILVQILRSRTPAEVDIDLEKQKRKEFDNVNWKIYSDYNSV